jgi:hypothetical protein
MISRIFVILFSLVAALLSILASLVKILPYDITQLSNKQFGISIFGISIIVWIIVFLICIIPACDNTINGIKEGLNTLIGLIFILSLLASIIISWRAKLWTNMIVYIIIFGVGSFAIGALMDQFVPSSTNTNDNLNRQHTIYDKNGNITGYMD